MAQVNHISRRRALFNPGGRDVGSAGTRNCFYTPWSSHLGDRISMGQKVALNSSSMVARPLSKNQVKEADLSRSVNGVEVTAQDFTFKILQVFGVNCARS
jgi:hypothetical protein